VEAARAVPPAPKPRLKDSYRNEYSASNGPKGCFDAAAVNIDADFSNTL
jgi:hypothetical protein